MNYYSRMRFAHNLLPQLTAASTDSNSISRVVSVLAGGREGQMIEDDLELKSHFSLANAANHATTMNSFAAEELAKRNPATSFVHIFPGFVNTNFLSGHSAWMSALNTVTLALLKPWVVPIPESGERHLYAATSPKFAPRSLGDSSAALGSDGVAGSGAYILNWDDEIAGKAKLLAKMREQGLGQKVWDHTQDVFKRAV